MMRLWINGEDHEVDAKTLDDLLKDRGVDQSERYVAVAVNGAVVPRAEWAGHIIGVDDEIEIVTPRSGG